MLKTISDIIWVITTILILYIGIYYTVYLKFPQFRWIKIMKSLKKESKEKSNSFKLLNLTLSGKIGVGSISGIALCIYIAGPSSLFWLWISVLILASLSYVETKLGIKYRNCSTKDSVGGPAFYIEKGLNKKNIARIYSILIIIAYVFAFISIQTNTIVISLENVFDINKIAIILVLLTITYLSIQKGIDTISKLTSFLTPIMGGLYILIGIIIIIDNKYKVLEILKNIVSTALSFKGFSGSILIPIIIGIERGIFSNEAGVGTTAMIASLSNDKNIEKQANIQIIGTLFTSLVICTITALIVLTSDYQNIMLSNINGIEIVSNAFYEHFGYFGIILLTLIIFLFAFSTIITSYYYGEINIKYLLNKNSKILKIIVIIVMIYSSFASPTILWNTVDILVALITIINVYAMFKLKNDV
ncbi:MAG: sodium:alanine symporter family protein [Bacilli bacterium]|nr:sodium:alanine symporter family protein [Bacilli bacterium]